MEQRKRGGLAGLYDRNKKIIAPVATGLAGLFNPLAGAAVGAAFKGMDRPGKSGIGFDVGKGAMGALQGYGMGKGLQSLKGMFTGPTPGLISPAPGAGAASGGAAGGGVSGGVSAADMADLAKRSKALGMTPTRNALQAMGSPATQSAASVAKQAVTENGPTLMGRIGSAAGRIGKSATSEEGIAALGGAAKAASGLIESQQDRAMEQRRLDEEEQRRQRLAELMLMFLPQMQFGPEAIGALGQGRMSGNMG